MGLLGAFYFQPFPYTCKLPRKNHEYQDLGRVLLLMVVILLCYRLWRVLDQKLQYDDRVARIVLTYWVGAMPFC